MNLVIPWIVLSDWGTLVIFYEACELVVSIGHLEDKVGLEWVIAFLNLFGFLGCLPCSDHLRKVHTLPAGLSQTHFTLWIKAHLDLLCQ